MASSPRSKWETLKAVNATELKLLDKYFQVADIGKQGYLEKQSKIVLRHIWLTRWIELKGKKLFLFTGIPKGEDSEEATIPTVERVQNSSRKFAFRVKTDSTESVFAAKSESEMKDWMDAISSSMRSERAMIDSWSKDVVKGTITVRILEGRNLAVKDVSGKSDPYVVLLFQKKNWTSKVIKQNLDPVWCSEDDPPNKKTETSFNVSNVRDELHVTVWDKDIIGSPDFMGKFDVKLSAIAGLDEVKKSSKPYVLKEWFPLERRKKSEKVSGDILLKISLLITESAHGYDPTDVFGVPIDVVMKHHPSSDGQLPHVMSECLRFLALSNQSSSKHEPRIATQGIFRMAASASEVEEYVFNFNNGGNVIFPEDVSPHLPAVLLKKFLRDMPDPLIPLSLYGHFSKSFNEGRTEEDRIKNLREALLYMPLLNRIVFHHLLRFLAAVSYYEADNKMSPSNLAIVIAPNILKSTDVIDMSGQQVLELLIRKWDVVYESEVPATYVPEDSLDREKNEFETATVLYDFESQEDNEITVRKGDKLIFIEERVDDIGWSVCMKDDVVGLVPTSYIRVS